MSRHAFAGTITNKDILSLLEACMSDDVVLQAIVSGDPKFDTFAISLIELKQKHRPPFSMAMMPSKERPAPIRAAVAGLNPEEVVLTLEVETQMQYIIRDFPLAVISNGSH